MFLFGL